MVQIKGKTQYKKKKIMATTTTWQLNHKYNGLIITTHFNTNIQHASKKHNYFVDLIFILTFYRLYKRQIHDSL